MKKHGILNRHLSGALASLGHTDGVLVCDAGMPIPDGPRVVDLAFRAGVPSFAEVLEGCSPSWRSRARRRRRRYGTPTRRLRRCCRATSRTWRTSRTRG